MPSSEVDLVDDVLAASSALVGVAARSIGALEGRVSLVQWRLLVVIHSHGPLQLGRAAAALATSPSSLSRLADRLETAGLLTRVPGPDSRRVVCLDLSLTGREVVETVLDRRRQELEKILETVPVKERAKVSSALATFERAAAAYFDGDAPAALWHPRPGSSRTAFQPALSAASSGTTNRGLPRPRPARSLSPGRGRPRTGAVRPSGRRRTAGAGWRPLPTAAPCWSVPG